MRGLGETNLCEGPARAYPPSPGAKAFPEGVFRGFKSLSVESWLGASTPSPEAEKQGGAVSNSLSFFTQSPCNLWKKILMANLPHCWEKSRHVLLYALAELLKVLSKLNFCKSYCIKN